VWFDPFRLMNDRDGLAIQKVFAAATIGMACESVSGMRQNESNYGLPSVWTTY
jgi:hypothetical protein